MKEVEKKGELFDEDNLPMWEVKKREMQLNNKKAMNKLICVTLLTIVFCTVEVGGGIYSHSIAVISDAAHLASDVLGIGVSICALALA
jgi:zinc transporter 2